MDQWHVRFSDAECDPAQPRDSHGGAGGKGHFCRPRAQFLLPLDRGLRVRLIPPLNYRVQQIMERRNLDFHEARDYVGTERTQDGNSSPGNYFHHDVA